MSTATASFRAASEAGEVSGMLDALAPGAFLRSPAAGRLCFQGREELQRLFTATTEAYEDVEYTRDFGAGRAWVLSFRARVGRQAFEETLLLELDEEGRIESLTASIRPMAGVVAVAAAVGKRLAPDRTRRLALVALTAPLAWMARSGDAIGSRLVASAPPGSRTIDEDPKAAVRALEGSAAAN